MPERICFTRSWAPPAGFSAFGLATRFAFGLALLPAGPPARLPAFFSGMCRSLPCTIPDAVYLGAALARDLRNRHQALKPVDRGPGHVVRIGRAERLGQDVGDAGALQQRTH